MFSRKLENLVDRLQKNATIFSHCLAYLLLIDGQEETLRVTYSEIDKKARAIAALLQNKQLFQQRVILLYPTPHEFIYAFLACLYAGVIAVPVYCSSAEELKKQKDKINAIAKNADISGVLTTSCCFIEAEECFVELIATKKIFIADTKSIEIEIANNYQKLFLQEETVAYLQYTSGSTATPTGVMIQHKNLMHSLYYSAKIWHYDKQSVMLNWSPHSHVYGLICGLLMPLYKGSSMIIMPPQAFIRRPLSWLEAITKYGVTHSGGPNFGYELCIRDNAETDLTHLNLRTWKSAINGGECVQYETLKRFSEKFSKCSFSLKKFCPAYGMSELTGAISVNPYKKSPKIFNLDVAALKDNRIVIATPKQLSKKFVSSGYLLPGLQVNIVDPETFTVVKPGAVGEIWLRGESVAAGYWQRAEETQSVFHARLPKDKNSYFRTGDLGFLIDKKELCVTGRLKELIIVYGKNYYPADLEIAAANAQNIFSKSYGTVAFSLTAPEKEQVIIVQEIKVEDSESENFDPEKIIHAIKQAIIQQFGIELHAVILVKAGTLPRTASGKMQRKLCREQYLAGVLQIVTRQGKLQPGNNLYRNLQKDITHIVAELLSMPDNEIDIHAPLSKYRFDSISLIKMTSLLNERYSITLTPANLFEYATLKEFCDSLLLNYQMQLINYYNISEKDLTHVSLIHDTKPSNFQPNMRSEIPIAVIGMAGIFPGADTVEEFWENLRQGKDVITEIPSERWNWRDYHDKRMQWGGFIKNMAVFDADFFNISRREAEFIDPQQRLLLQTVWHAVEEAGYAINTLAKQKVGLFIGASTHDYAELIQKNDQMDAYVTTGITSSILANRISYLLNLQGPSEVIDTACSSSLVAVHHAMNAIQNGDCEWALVGGVNALLTPTLYRAASKAEMLTKTGQCKTFDKNADGYVRSEGVAAILLKPLDKAQIAGDHIYAIIKGSAVNHGGHVSSLSVPNPNAQADVIVTAHQRAGISVDTINYIETHGTGTTLGDPIEINGLKKAFDILRKKQGKEKLENYYCGLGAVKTQVGHLEAAAGLTGIVKVLLALKYKQLPGNLHFHELNPYIEITESPFYIVDKTQPWQSLKEVNGRTIPRRAGVSSFGFGGTNAHIVLEEYPLNKISETLPQKLFYIIALSAKTESALQQRVKDLQDWIAQQKENISLGAMSYTLNVGRDHFKQRCAFIVESLSELQKTLMQVQQGERSINFIAFNESGDALNETFPSVEMLINELNASNIFSSMEYRQKLLMLAKCYVCGQEIEWEKLSIYKINHRISLPGYPFEKNYYWIAPNNLKTPTIDFDTEFSDKINTTVVEKNVPVDSIILSAVEKTLVEQTAIALKTQPSVIQIAQSFYELGFDSIGLKQFTAQLENYYKISLNPAVFFTNSTIQSLSRHFAQTYPGVMEKFYSFQKNSHLNAGFTEITHENKSYTKLPPLTILEKSIETSPIAIVGMQGMFPQSKDVNAFWEHLVAGDDLITEIPSERWNWRDYYGDSKHDVTKTNSKWGGFISDFDQFDAAFFNLSSREVNLMDPQHRLFLETVWRVIEDAGYDPLSFAKREVGIFVGVEFSEYQTLLAKQKNLLQGHVATGTSHALLANRVSYFLNLQGPSEVVDTACSSSLVSIHRAVTALRNQECELAIAGGVSLILNPQTYVITSQLGALSSEGRCKTFDKSANGYVKGEGVAAILLKPLQKALQDSDHVYAIIKGTAVNHGGKAQSLTAPNAAAQSQLLVKAYKQAQIDPHTVTYIETHGTGTELGDPIEIEALKQAFNTLLETQFKWDEQTQHIALGSVKTNIGHLEPASGIASVVKVLLAMKYGKIPRNLHCKELNPYIQLKGTPFYLANELHDWKCLHDATGMEIPRRAGVSSFGFGGTNAHIVLEEMPSFFSKENKKNPFFLIALSGKKEQSLKQKIVDLHTWLKNNLNVDLSGLAFTLNVGRSHFNFRCAIIVDSLEDLLETLQKLVQGEQPSNYLYNKGQAFDSNSPIFQEIYNNTLAILKKNDSLTPTLYKEKLLLLADLYIKYYPIDWSAFYEEEKPQRISGLPTYPFIKQRYWFDLEFQKPIETKPIVNLPVKTNSEKIENLDLTDFTLNYLKQIFAEKLRLSVDQIAMDETYEIYGVDSLLGLEITHRLEKDLGDLPKTLLYEKNQLQVLAEYLEQRFQDKLIALAGKQNYFFEISSKSIEIEHEKNSAHDFSTVSKKENLIEDIAIIGLSGIYPLAKNIDEFWKNLVEGRDCITEIPPDRWNYKDYPVNVGGQEKYYKYGGFIPDVDKFDPLFFSISPNDAALMDPQERLFMQSAWSTLEDAGYTRERLKMKTNNQLGIFVGVTYNFYPLFVAEEWAKGNRLPLDIQMFSMANRVSYFLNANGPSYPIDTACSSALAAIHLACESIIRGECLMAIAGGINLSLHPAKYHMLGSYSFMADSGRCTSFAADGNGYVPAEGVGSIVLKPLSLAKQDNDQIYGVIKASVMNHGGKTSGYTVPNPNAQAALIKNALEKAKIDPRTITYIEAHGTGTSLGDPIEIRGLQEAFSHFTKDKQFCAIGSVKSNIGHLESAAGISQLTKVLLQLKHKKLVPSLHAEKLNPYIDFEQTPFYVQRELTDWPSITGQPRRAGISSFGAGGTNVHLIVEEYLPTENYENNAISVPFIFLLSALTAERLREYAQQMYAFLFTNGKDKIEKSEWLNDLCYTTQIGREAMAVRLAILATSYEDLLKKLHAYLTDDKAVSDYWVAQSEPLAKSNFSSQEIKKLLQQLDYPALLSHWVKGGKINWEEMYKENKPRCISLPTYPFAKRRCWIPTQTLKRTAEIISSSVTSTTISVKPAANNGLIKNKQDWLYDIKWEKQLLVNKDIVKNETWIIFSDKALSFHLQDELGKENKFLVFVGEKFQQFSKNIFYINPAQADDYYQLLISITQDKNFQLKGVLYLWTHDQTLDETQHAFYILHLLQALLKHPWTSRLRVGLITRSSQIVTEAESIKIWEHYLWSLLRIFSIEQSTYEILLLDLDEEKSLRQEAHLIAQEIQNYHSDDYHVAYRCSERYVIRLAANKMQQQSIPWIAPEALLITGGLGGLGLTVAEWLVQRGAKYLLLTGRTVLPERAHWNLAVEESVKEKIQAIINLEKQGATVVYVDVDVSTKDRMFDLIRQTERNWQKKITGVFHLAGVTTDSIPISQMTDEVLKDVFESKIQGTLVLHELFNTKDTQCFVLFSSVSSTPYFGLNGLSAYAMANAFLDGLAAYRRQMGLSALSANWIAWSEKGMSFRHNHDAFLTTMGMSSLSLQEGMAVLNDLLQNSLSNKMILKINWEKFFQINPLMRRLPFFAALAKNYVTSSILKTPSTTLNAQQIAELLTNTLAKIVGLTIIEIDAEKPFQSYGLDSINGINFIAQLSAHFPDILSPMDLYRYPSVKQLTGYLVQLMQPTTDGQTSVMGKTVLSDEANFLAAIAHLEESEINQLIEEEYAGVEE